MVNESYRREIHSLLVLLIIVNMLVNVCFIPILHSLKITTDEYYLRVHLNSATLNGQELDISNPEIQVKPGTSIEGTITVTVENVQPGSWITSVIWVTSWERGPEYVRVISDDIRSTKTFTVKIKLIAPQSPGTYYIGVFAGWRYSPDELASNNHFPQYEDGDDVWDMPQRGWEEVLKQGKASTGPYHEPGRAIRVKVIESSEYYSIVIGVSPWTSIESSPNYAITREAKIKFGEKVYSFTDSSHKVINVPAGTYTVEAIPPSNWGFLRWYVGVAYGTGVEVSDEYANPTKVTVSGNGSLYADFGPCVTFYTNPTDVGSITISGGDNSGTYVHGQKVVLDTQEYTIKANVPSGYKFEKWITEGYVSVDSSTKEETTLDVTGPGSITAVFSKVSVPNLSVELIEPANGATLTSSPITLKVRIKDDTGNYIEGATVKFYVDSNYIGYGVSDGNGYASIEYSPSKGSHTWYVEVEKSGYNSAISPQWSFTYNPPTIALNVEVSVTPESITVGQYATILVTVTANGEPIEGASITLTSNGGSINPNSGVTDSNGKFTATFTSNTPGTYTITVSASKAGYTSSSSSVQIVVMTKPPSVYEVTVNIKGLPPSLTTKIFVDNEYVRSVTGSTTITLKLSDGATHTISVNKIVYEGDNIRYTCLSNAKEVGKSTTIDFTYIAEYKLVIVHKVTPDNIVVYNTEAWYGANTVNTLTFSGVRTYKGERYILGYVSIDDEKYLHAFKLSITMDKPHNIYVVYVKESSIRTLTDWLSDALGILSKEEVIKAIIETANKGEKYFYLILKMPLEIEKGIEQRELIERLISEQVAGSGKITGVVKVVGVAGKTINLAVDATYIVSLIKDNSLTVEQKVDKIREFMGSVTRSSATYLTAYALVTAFGGPVAVAGITCLAIDIALSTLAPSLKEEVDRTIGKLWTDSIDWLYIHLVTPLLKIFGGSSVYFLVIDEEGRCVGAVFENGTWTNVCEIPNAWYSGVDSHPQMIFIPNPQGKFKIMVYGNENCTFHLNIVEFEQESMWIV